MKLGAARAISVLALLLAGAIPAKGQRNYHDQSLDLIRFLATEPWGGRGRWDRAPRIDSLYYNRNDWAPVPTADQMDGLDEEIRKNALRIFTQHRGVQGGMWDSYEFFLQPLPATLRISSLVDLVGTSESHKVASTKRSAVATALNGRRRRQPTSPLGKGVTPYVGVGILNDLGSFITAFRENVDNLASLSPSQRATIFQEPPTVVRAATAASGGSTGGGGGGVGIRRIHALRPLRPTGNIRTYNRRSFVEPEAVYPGANHHDPGLLWTGLGR